MRWTDSSRDTRDRRRKKTLTIELRDANGRIIRRRAAEIEKEVRHKSMSLELANASGKKVRKELPDRPLTIEAGLNQVLDPERGKYDDPDNRRVRELMRIRDRLFEGDSPLISTAMTWEEWQPQEAQTLWRKLARINKHKGPRHAEVIVDFIYSSAAWLRLNHKIPLGAALPNPTWRRTLRMNWGQITHWSQVEEQPRHSAEEMGRIFAALPGCDQRIALALELGAELRLGQVGRCRRSDFQPKPEPFAPLGLLRIRSSGNKRGVNMALDEKQRAILDDAMFNGYLRECEAAFRSGSIDDYYLFPSGKLVKRVARARSVRDSKPLRREQMLELFHGVERAAGVTSERGRGWYGLRRISSDLAADITPDARVLDAIGGWRDPATRMRLYQRKNDKKIGLRAQEVRQQMRSNLPIPRYVDREEETPA